MTQQSIPNTEGHSTPDFALLGHPDGYNHLSELILHSRPDYDPKKIAKYRATLSKFFEWAPSYTTRNELVAAGPQGARFAGRLIICTFLPESMTSTRQMKLAYNKTRQGMQVAQEMGARTIALGGLTSILLGTHGAKLSDEFGVAVTTGSSLTAALAVAQLDGLLGRLVWSLANRTIAILGASGDIGRACTLALAPRARRTVLFARNRAKLQSFRDELPGSLNVYVSTDLDVAASADVIVAATSADEPIFAESDLRPGTIVMDIGYPKNLAYAANPRPDVLVVSAGLAELTFDLGIQYYTKLPTPRIMYGCFAEAIVLTMAGREESYSVARGKITLEMMDSILTLAREQGIHPAPTYRGDVPMDDNRISRFLSLAAV